MDTRLGMLVIIGVCVLVLLIGLVRKRAEFVINFVLRGTMGLVAIYILNEVFAVQSIQLSVGINPISVSLVSFLGLPGVALLYGITGCQFL
jgi:pro-sigmaK processing inhibitor BofA